MYSTYMYSTYIHTYSPTFTLRSYGNNTPIGQRRPFSACEIQGLKAFPSIALPPIGVGSSLAAIHAELGHFKSYGALRENIDLAI